MHESYSYSARQEQQLDKLTDQGFSPERARRMLGIALDAPDVSETLNTSKDPSFQSPSDHKPRPGKSEVQYGDGASIETPSGRPDYEISQPPLSKEEIARIHHFTKNWRDIAKRAIAESPSSPDSDE